MELEKGVAEKQRITSKFIRDTLSTIRKCPTNEMDNKTLQEINNSLSTIREPQGSDEEKFLPKFAKSVKDLASSFGDLMTRLSGNDLKERQDDIEEEYQKSATFFNVAL